MRIALLEDDRDQAALVEMWLADASFDIASYPTGEAFLGAIRQERYDLYILDWLLPGVTGLDVLRSLRGGARDSTPVLFVTQFDAEEKVVEALEAGADDYVAKPVTRAVLLARVRALLRRAGDQPPAEPTVGVYRIDAAARCVHVRDNAVQLTEREFELARYLFARVGRVVTRDELLREVWRVNAEGLETRTIDTHVSKLRRKLDLNAEHGLRLQSIYNHGYRLETAEDLTSTRP
jgi:two-component system response regulator RegX3